MKTCTGTLDISRSLPRRVSETTYAGGNARQRRRKIRQLKAQGWEARSWLRIYQDLASPYILTNKR